MDNKKGNKFLGKMIMGDEVGYLRPFSRRGQIWYLLRHYLPTILLSSIMTTAYIVPFALLLIISRSMITHAISLTPEYTPSIVLTYNFYTFLIAIPLVMIMGLGMCGMNNIIKRLALEQGATFFDYYLGIKENFVKYLFSYFLLGLSLFLLINGINMINARAGLLTPFLYGLSFGLVIVQFIVVSYFTFVSNFLSLLYEMKFFDYLKNSIRISFHGFFFHLVFVILAIAIWFLPIFLPNLVLTVVYIVLALLGPIISSFATMLYGCFYTDKFINFELYPEYYHRGLYDYINREQEQSEV